MEVRDERDIMAVVEKLLKAIQAPCDIGRRDPPVSPSVSASFGIAVFPKNGTTAAALVKSADTAMYEAKRSNTRYAFAK